MYTITTENKINKIYIVEIKDTHTSLQILEINNLQYMLNLCI